ncbi:MAG: SprT family zinc-dependent metalloprotease [bacterium]
MTKKYIEIDGIEMLFKKSLKAKKLTIKVRPKDGIIVTMPWYFAYNKAQDFARTHLEWIKSNLKKMQDFKKNLVIFDENTEFSTKKHHLFIQKKDIKKSISSIKDGKIVVKFPLNEDISKSENQDKIRKAITEAFRIEAKEFLPQRVEFLAQKFGLKYKDLAIKNMTSRWGSCSGHNNINLNLNLARLPEELIDYVILHELAHTKEKNHSKKFWDFLEKLLPNSKELNKKLRFYKMEVF